MTDTARTTALVLARGLAASGVGHLICDPVRAGSVPVRCVRSIVRRAALRPLARRLMASSLSERREIAALLSAALDAGHYSAALALVSTAGRRPDLYAEKILSQRYRFLWLGVPKAASRSVIAALRAADPKALLVHKLSLDELLAAYPEARDYFRFAFLRHPYARLLSFYADKHVRGRHDRAAYRWFIEPWRGLRPGMGFDEAVQVALHPLRVRCVCRPALAVPVAPGHRRGWPPAGLPGPLRDPGRRLAHGVRAPGTAWRAAAALECRGL